VDATPADIERLLFGLGLEASNVVAVGAGAWSRAFGFDTPAGRRVVRVGDLREDFDKDALASALDGPDLPVPRIEMVGPCALGFYAISEWVPGTPLEECSAADWPSLGASVARMLLAKAAVEPFGPGWGAMDTRGVGSQPSWRAHLLSVTKDDPSWRTHGWWETLAADPARAAVHRHHAALLAEVAPIDVPRAVIHGDLLNRNVHVADGAVTGVFDWGCAVYGDPLYDLAWFEFWSPHYPALVLGPIFEAVLGPGGSDAARCRRLLASHLHIGLDHLGYNAYLENWDQFAAVEERLAELVAEYRS